MSVSDVRCFCGALEMSDKEVARAQRGGGVCVRADGQAADGLGGKPGTGLPFLDGRTSDVHCDYKITLKSWACAHALV